MDIYLTDVAKKKTVRIPKLPETVSVHTGTSTTTVNILDLGEVGIPRGQTLASFEWDSDFPGKHRNKEPWLRGSWQDPNGLVAQFNAWRDARTSLQLLVTGTTVNERVYVNTFEPGYSGGYRDITYSLSLYRDIDISVGFVGSGATSSGTVTAMARAASAKASTYTVVKGDSLWSICQHKLGNGSRYPELYALNKALLDARNKKSGTSKYTIYAGQVLTLPT